MKYIRRWVYRLGFRPKYGSIFFSPSLSWTKGFADLMKKENKNG